MEKRILLQEGLDDISSPPQVELPKLDLSHYLPTENQVSATTQNGIGTIPRIKALSNGEWLFLPWHYKFQLVHPLPEMADPDFKYPVIIRCWGEDYLMERSVLYNCGSDTMATSFVQWYTAILGLQEEPDHFLDQWYTRLPSANPRIDTLWPTYNPGEGYRYEAGWADIPSGATPERGEDRRYGAADKVTGAKAVIRRPKGVTSDEVVSGGLVLDVVSGKGKIYRARSKAEITEEQPIFDALDLAVAGCFSTNSEWAVKPPEIQTKFSLGGEQWRAIYNRWNSARKVAAERVIHASMVEDKRLVENKVKLFKSIGSLSTTNEKIVIPEGAIIGIVDWDPPQGQKPQIERPIKVMWDNQILWASRRDILTNWPKENQMARERKVAEGLIDRALNSEDSTSELLDTFLVERNGEVSEVLAKDPFAAQDVFALFKRNETLRKAVGSLVGELKKQGMGRDRIIQVFHVIPDILDRVTTEKFFSHMSDDVDRYCSNCGSSGIVEDAGSLFCSTCNTVLEGEEETVLACDECGVELVRSDMDGHQVKHAEEHKNMRGE
jgi:predicted RNA-binding Zn-ribbon protein involved in translation (DUF1610 family)